MGEALGGKAEEKFVRYGSVPETTAHLAADAAAAEKMLGFHGVSVILRRPPKFPHMEASVSTAMTNFTITQTGTNKSHYTVELPKPVTEEVTDKFNEVFIFGP